MTDYRAAPYILQPAPERLMWPWIIGIASIAIGAKEFISFLPLCVAAIASKGAFVYGYGGSDFGIAYNYGVMATTVLLPVMLMLAGCWLLFRRRHVLLIVYSFVAICCGIAILATNLYDLVTSHRLDGNLWAFQLLTPLSHLLRLAFPVLLVFWYYTGRPSRQLRQWCAGVG